jgi:hypothetical protein
MLEQATVESPGRGEERAFGGRAPRSRRVKPRRQQAGGRSTDIVGVPSLAIPAPSSHGPIGGGHQRHEHTHDQHRHS